MFTKKISLTEWVDLIERIKVLEEKVLGKKKAPLSLNQQILILSQLGMLDKINQLPISNEKKYNFLALLLKADKSNTKKGMNELSKNDADIINVPNYRFLSKLFNEFDMDDQAITANNKLRQLEKVIADDIDASNLKKFNIKK